MPKRKICVYAICKNEEKFVDRFVESVKEADAIYVLDTGSTDNTVKLLKEHGVNVKSQKITPWRFDVARNLSLEMVPKDADICVCLDLDEVIEKGWRKKLEQLWTNKTTRLSYNYNWSLDENNRPKVNFYIQKIHSRQGYHWTHPVHEVLTCDLPNEVIKRTDEITVNHYPDASKSRSSYLPLLELSVKEDPEDDRNLHYLGREYMYYHRWNDCIDTLIKHLACKNATWKEERSASMRFIARSYIALKRYEEAKMWLEKAIQETPYLRDPYLEMAFLYNTLKDYPKVITYVEKALKITHHEKIYINETFSWDSTPYDLLSVSYFYLGDKTKALENVEKALSLNPKDPRLLENCKLIKNSLKETL